MTTRLSLTHAYRVLLTAVLRRPVPTILIVLAVTALFAVQLPRLSFRTSVYELIIDDLPETARYEAFKGRFGSDEIIRVVVRGADMLAPETFGTLRELSSAAAAIPGVRRVIGLPAIKEAVDPGNAWGMDRFAEVIGPADLFERNLISADRRTSVMTLVLTNDADIDAVIGEVQRLISAVPKPLSAYQIGMPLVSEALAAFTEKDFFRLPPITLALIALILLVLFRRLPLILLPVTCVLLPVAWTFGFMAWTGIPVSMLTMIVPVFLIAVGTAYCLHILFAYLDRARTASGPRTAVSESFSHIVFPTVLAVLTTVIGLGSLLLNHIVAIREFAVLSCFGMGSLLCVVLTLFPAALSLVPLPAPGSDGARRRATRFSGFLDGAIERIIRLNLRHQRIALPLLLLLVLFCAVGVFRIEVETNPMEFFKGDTPVSRHFHDIYRDMSGSFPINVVMESPHPGFFEDPESIAGIDRLQDYLRTLHGVDKTLSFADYLKLVNYASNGFAPEYYALPEEGFEVRMLVNNYKTMLGTDMLDRFMGREFSRANIMLLTHISSSSGFLAIREQILDFVRENFPDELAWEVTGFGVVISASSHLLTQGQVKSLSLTLVVVFGIMFLLFLSSKVGLIAIVPNLFPIVINFGLMGWLGIELSTVTSLIASIAIGLAVDDTIHYLVRYNQEFRVDLDEERAMAETLRHVGKPILSTTLTISVGFSILALSSFTPTAVFGLMMVVTMLAALVGDMILLPSLMLHAELVTLWDLVRLRLGKDPRHGIPLFNGMSRTEVHFIIMAGTLVPVDAGKILFRKGDESDTMYALISGELDVLADPVVDWDASSHEPIARLTAGDIVGEMGLIRSAKRSAAVVASGYCELLLINWKMIKRLQWLYPPTGYKFMMNLSTIICNRLERTTQSLYEKTLMDGLTGVYNHQGFMDYLEKQAEHNRRYGTDLSLCLLGVAFEGDRGDGADYCKRKDLLCSLSKTLCRELRQCDALGRIDYRTFAILLPHTGMEKACQARDRLRNALGKTPFQVDGVRLTIRFGLASLPPGAAESPAGFLDRAAADLRRVMGAMPGPQGRGGDYGILPTGERLKRRL